MTTYIARDKCNELLVKHGDGADGFHKFANAAIQAYRDSLVAGVVLPEPTWICVHTEGADFDFSLVRTRTEAQELVDIELADSPELTLTELCTDLFTADQLRQAIADDRIRQQDYLQDIAAFIGVGGYNGATTEQTVERIKVEFQRLDNVLIKRARNPMFEFRECEDSQAIAAPTPKDTDAKT